MSTTEPLIIDWLTFRCYEYNRVNNPHIMPHQWEHIFPDAKQYELILKEQKKVNYVKESTDNLNA